MSTHVLELKNVTKRVGSKTLVDNLSFQVGKGEIVGLLGPNGAGKTTTMKMMVGLFSMSEGDVTINGHSVKTARSKALAHVGGILENPEFYPFLSGYDNLMQYARMADGVTEERIKEVVELLGLSNALDKKVKAYSLGMRQRLGIAQALLHKPAVLILDEPTNGLDPAGIREMREYMRQIANEEGISILVSSHLLSEVELMCDRIIIIQNGKFVEDQRIIESETDEVTLALVVDDTAKASAILAKDFNLVADVHEKKVLITLEDEQVPAIITKLASEGIAIFRVMEEKKSLEDRFLEKTGGNQIV
ncbi:ABC transporter ATP-binding protein [Priestia taiwanensis]|uniref:ABC transporter ATP-binding protein n=1 Tax=Priestia taiwanensis TaxID=1347902 RepID=A0A917AVL8_9BACI|nr:ABC transporter ATP-binding protein [Priestia taiwanensis]MBM7363488.1 ABC-2 type transport system ATP-binding protein [Priestia taiwanensis]GGE76729.1 ABC transporter ATP-binding protein [Priestia taiwanensis]